MLFEQLKKPEFSNEHPKKLQKPSMNFEDDEWKEQEGSTEQRSQTAKDNQGSTYRTDRYNTIVQKGNKNHRVSFRDNIEETKGLKDIYVVENWAVYNKKSKKESACCVIM